jgi:predicted tellurium resistance membrane protein TerC
MNARVALAIMVLMTVAVALVRFFEQNWILGTTAAMVVVGTGFVGASMYFSQEEQPDPRLAQIASKLRAIGLIVIGLGTLFGALMLLL